MKLIAIYLTVRQIFNGDIWNDIETPKFEQGFESQDVDVHFVGLLNYKNSYYFMRFRQLKKGKTVKKRQYLSKTKKKIVLVHGICPTLARFWKITSTQPMLRKLPQGGS